MLVFVSLLLERDVVVNGLYELVKSVGNGVSLVQPFLVYPLSKEDVRSYCTVNLGRYYALAHKAALHSLLVLFPFGCEAINVERSEQRNVLLRQPFNSLVAKSAVGKVHHRVELHVGAFGFKHLQKSDEHSVYAVNRVSALFEGENQLVRIAHRAGYYYSRSIFLNQIVLLQICLVVLDAFEENILVVGMFDVGVREHSGWRWSGGVDVSAEDDFLVYICADVVEHRAIVLSACSA